MDAYLDALALEAGLYASEEVKSVYIGGGTPTFLDCSQLERIFVTIRSCFRVDPGAEWTIEANPDGLDRLKLAVLRDHGINRMSLGIQSFNDQYLSYLGRSHTARVAMEAYASIREAGFDNVNVDVIFGVPGESRMALRDDLTAMVRLGSDHISLYALTIEDPSRFHAKRIVLPEKPEQAWQYQYVCDFLQKAGFKQYEISNFAKGSKVSRHNVNYWMGGEYIGLGVGAHSYLGHQRFWNVSKLTEYLSLLKDGSCAREASEFLSESDQLIEVVLFGLRMNQGVDVQGAEERFHCRLSDDQRCKIDDWITGGLLTTEGSYLRTTDRGRLVLDEICARLI